MCNKMWGQQTSRVAAICLATVIGMTGPVWSASFQGMGDLPGGDFKSYAYDVSADGSIVVGTSESASGEEAFRWAEDGGMVPLGDLPGGTFESQGGAVSADGSVVVGTGESASGEEAFRWTEGGGMVALGDLPGGTFSSSAYFATDVSADGSTIVGYGEMSYLHPEFKEAFRWTADGGMVGMGYLPGGTFTSIAAAVSADGSVVVGISESASPGEAFRWTSTSGMVGLGYLPGGSFESYATAVSADGSVVAGTRESAAGHEMFRWTSTGGMVGLGDLPGGAFESYTSAVSVDGSVVVGTGESDSGWEAAIWDATNGMRNLKDVLTSLGVDMTGWSLTYAAGVSADGMTVVGSGTNPSGADEAWIARGQFHAGTERTPVAGMLGLLALACGCILGGVRTFHRKR